MALSAPLVIMRGMASNWATPTEAGVLAVAYAIFVGAVQRNLTFRAMTDAPQEMVLVTGSIIYVIAISKPDNSSI